MKQLVDFFQDKKVKTLLDIGTGSGDFIPVLKEVFPNINMIGVDPNIDSLKEAEKLHPNVSFKEMGAEKLEFTDNSFDAASISMALHHLPDIRKSFSEMKRVVKFGGWIIICELFSDNLNQAQEVHKMYHHFISRLDRILGISHNKTFRKDEIIQMVENAGIDIKFHFEFEQDINQISSYKNLEERVSKMQQLLDKIKGYHEYEILAPQIGEFQERASKYGFQPTTRVVVVGRV